MSNVEAQGWKQSIRKVQVDIDVEAEIADGTVVKYKNTATGTTIVAVFNGSRWWLSGIGQCLTHEAFMSRLREATCIVIASYWAEV